MLQKKQRFIEKPNVGAYQSSESQKLDSNC